MIKEGTKNAGTSTGVSANLVLIVPFTILKMTVNTSWQEITVLTVLALSVIDKFVNSGKVKKGASEKQIANTYMRTQKMLKVQPGMYLGKNVMPVGFIVITKIV